MDDAQVRALLMSSNTLSHFGIKGQKWGVRRTDAQLGNNPSVRDSFRQRAVARKEKLAAQENARKEKLKQNNQTDVKFKNKDYKNMSDDELRKVLARLNQEEQFKRLVPVDKSTATKVISTVATTAALLKTVNDAVGGLDKLTTKITPDQSKQLSTILNGLNAVVKKK